MNDITLRVENVSKQYRLGAIGGTTLREEVARLIDKFHSRKTLVPLEDENGRRIGDKFMALDNVSFEVQKGEALGIIGHNGAGKSTLLKLLSRVTGPTSGRISFNGRISSMLEVGTGFHPELTGRENIYMNGAILGMSKAEVDSKIEKIIDFSEVRKFIDTPVKRYSSGMYVKLAFSVAAHLDSEIMIMDEVLAVGDMAFQKKCLGKMSDSARVDGKTILYVSHNMNTIRQMCSRCLVLHKGKIIYNGGVENAIEYYIGQKQISDSSIDFRDRARPDDMLPGIRIQKIVNNQGWSIKAGAKLHYELYLQASKKLSQVGYRTRLTAADGTSVSVLLAPKLINCFAGEELRIPIEADVSSLVPGRYNLTLSLYTVNEYGGWNFYDIVDGVTFEVENILGFNENMTWDPYYWGYIKLPELKKMDRLL